MNDASEDRAPRDDPESHRFLFEQDGLLAELIYRSDPEALVLVHTEVPAGLGGRGIGGRLVRAAVQKAQREHLTVVPWCPYARDWLGKHPDVAQGVAVDWTLPTR
ncbi:MAG: GNAT family N-acetyltransferase [Acidimicrobiales bacterium]